MRSYKCEFCRFLDYDFFSQNVDFCSKTLDLHHFFPNNQRSNNPMSIFTHCSFLWWLICQKSFLREKKEWSRNSNAPPPPSPQRRDATPEYANKLAAAFKNPDFHPSYTRALWWSLASPHHHTALSSSSKQLYFWEKLFREEKKESRLEFRNDWVVGNSVLNFPFHGFFFGEQNGKN